MCSSVLGHVWFMQWLLTCRGISNYLNQIGKPRNIVVETIFSYLISFSIWPNIWKFSIAENRDASVSNSARSSAVHTFVFEPGEIHVTIHHDDVMAHSALLALHFRITGLFLRGSSTGRPLVGSGFLTQTASNADFWYISRCWPNKLLNTHSRGKLCETPRRPGPRLNIKTIFPKYEDSHVKYKTAVTNYISNKAISKVFLWKFIGLFYILWHCQCVSNRHYIIYYKSS